MADAGECVVSLETLYYVVCDCCGWSPSGSDGEPREWGSRESALDAFQAYDGLQIGELDLCAKCWRIDDEGEYVRAHVVHPPSKDASHE